MRRTRWCRWPLLLIVACLVTLPGCGGCGGYERGKNSDFDRPRAPTDRTAEKKAG